MVLNREETENKRIATTHLKEERLTIYTALEELNFLWSLEQVTEFDEMWRSGLSLEMIAEYFERDIDEVAVLLMDRSRKGRIRKRKYGIRG